MGIQAIIGDIRSNAGQTIQSLLDTAYSHASGMAGSIGTFISNVYDGGFAGVSDFDALKQAITRYKEEVQSIVDTYNANADLEQTFKGEVATAMHEFVTNTKTLLEAYASMVEQWNIDLVDVYTKYQEGASSTAQKIQSDAQDVLAAAQNISLD